MTNIMSSILFFPHDILSYIISLMDNKARQQLARTCHLLCEMCWNKFVENKFSLLQQTNLDIILKRIDAMKIKPMIEIHGRIIQELPAGLDTNVKKMTKKFGALLLVTLLKMEPKKMRQLQNISLDNSTNSFIDFTGKPRFTLSGPLISRSPDHEFRKTAVVTIKLDGVDVWFRRSNLFGLSQTFKFDDLQSAINAALDEITP